MSEQNENQPNTETIAELGYMEIINATTILQLAIERNTFTVSELVKVAPVVEKFQQFCEVIKQEQEKTAQQELSSKEDK